MESSMNKEIVWLEDPLQYSYLRESLYRTTRPKTIKLKTPIWNDQAKIIGYEIFNRKYAPAQDTYARRVWWLKTHDRDLDPEGVYKRRHPCEAVVPQSICVGVESMFLENIR
jgi:hypothetical protein